MFSKFVAAFVAFSITRMITMMLIGEWGGGGREETLHAMQNSSKGEMLPLVADLPFFQLLCLLYHAHWCV